MKKLVLPILLAGMLPAADSELVSGLNSFTVKSYKQLNQGDGNRILSPLNVATVLSMVLAGARGQTADEIRSVLGVQNDPGYDASVGALLAGLAKNGNAGGNELLTADGLWVQKGFDLEPAFEKTMETNYRAPLSPVDFITDAEAVRSRINRWTEERTKGRIKNLLRAGSLNGQTRLVLASAIYFWGRWQAPFVTSKTKPAPFTLPTAATTQAAFMNQTSHFGYTETPSAQLLEMGYAGTGSAFDILLPKTAAGLPELERSLTKDALTGWLGNLAARDVQLSLPKFRAESEFSLGKPLAAMGMPTPFSNQADFSGISGKRGLMISEVVHKALVEVSERGTEAAAASGAVIAATTARAPEQTVVFRADHPFIFLIRDTRTGAILFIGRLTDPR
ncbi:MAG TPA: serpin family protein [Bryobacteraceae bacterium]